MDEAEQGQGNTYTYVPLDVSKKRSVCYASYQ
jgi:hypothetical protein